MYVNCKRCNIEFWADDNYRGSPKRVCNACTKKRITEFQYRYHFTMRKNHVPKVVKLRADIKSGNFVNDFTHYGYKTHRSFGAMKSRLKSEGLYINPIQIVANG